jgi:hypothetical protein
MAFQSEFENNDKLKLCAIKDSDHISEKDSPRGPWVVLIKKALNAWAAKQNPPVEALGENDFYDSDTGARVALYKTRQTPPIINFAGQIDRIVGKKTVAALDKELPKLRVPTTVVTETVDVIVRFIGAGDFVTLLTPQQVFPDAFLSEYNKKPNRKLIRMGQTTITIRSESASLIEIKFNQIKEFLTDKVVGKIFIFGSSSGGRNALDLAIRLSQESIPIEYVGILDAAFFPDEKSLLKNSAGFNSSDKEPKIIPLFALPNINAARKENFFQTLGNHFDKNKLGVRNGQFGSAMGGKEIHGIIESFNPRNFTEQVKASNPKNAPNAPSGETFDDHCHINLTAAAEPILKSEIKAILDSL